MPAEKCKNCEHVCECWGEKRPEVTNAKKAQLKCFMGEFAAQVTATTRVLEQLSESARTAFCEAARQWDESSALILADAAADLKSAAIKTAAVVFRMGLNRGAKK